MESYVDRSSRGQQSMPRTDQVQLQGRSAAEGTSGLNYSFNAVNSALALASKCLNDNCFINYDMKYQ